MPQEWLNLMLDPFTTFWSGVAMKLPSVVGALLLLLAGSILARVIRELMQKLLASSRIDDFLGKVGFAEILSRVGFGRSVSYAVSFLTYWLILLVFFVSAANAINLTVVSELLNRFVLFMPKLIASVLVLIGGVILGHFVGEIVKNACQANHIHGGIILSRVFKVVVVMFAAIMSLEELGINTLVLTSSIQIVLATLGLAVAIAFGLGGKDVAAEIIRGFLRDQNKHS